MIEEVARITQDRGGIRSTRPASHGHTRRSAAGTESGCLHDLIPNATVFGLLVNPNNPSAEILSKQAEEATRAIGVQLVVLRAGSEAELDEVFASLTGQRIGGLIVSTDPFISIRFSLPVACPFFSAACETGDAHSVESFCRAADSGVPAHCF
jgi:hypothetical protein